MIGRLTGELLIKSPPHLLVDVQGVGYEVSAPMSTFYQLPERGRVVLHTHLAISEAAHQLFGFASLSERELFRQLIKVSGVGPKLALAVLSALEPDQVVKAIRQNDLVSLTRIPGVGKKTAERLVIEMRDRVDGLQAATQSSKAASGAPADATAEAESALLALGYKAAEAQKALQSALKQGAPHTTEALIRHALRAMLPA
jgi:holliday junction DNA helicase RuvA